MGREYFTKEEKDYYDSDRREICIDGEKTRIGGNLKKILDYLILNRNIPMSNDAILDMLYPAAAGDVNTHTVKSNINTLRHQKLGKYGNQLILNINNEGYFYVGPLEKLEEPPKREPYEVRHKKDINELLKTIDKRIDELEKQAGNANQMSRGRRRR